MKTSGSSGKFLDSSSRIAAPWAGPPRTPSTTLVGCLAPPQAPLDCPGRGCNAEAHMGICFEGLTFWNELGLFVGS